MAEKPQYAPHGDDSAFCGGVEMPTINRETPSPSLPATFLRLPERRVRACTSWREAHLAMSIHAWRTCFPIRRPANSSAKTSPI